LLLLRRPAGSLLLGLILCQLLIEITFTGAAGNNIVTVNAKIPGDKVLIDLVFEDQAPFAESLKTDQQDQYYRDGIFYHRAQSYKYSGIKS